MGGWREGWREEGVEAGREVGRMEGMMSWDKRMGGEMSRHELSAVGG